MPTSAILHAGTWNSNRDDGLAGLALISPANLETERFLNSCEHDKKEDKDGSSREIDILCSNDNGIQTPPLDFNTGTVGAWSSPVPVTKEVKTPLTKLSNSSSSRDWLLDSGDKHDGSVEQQFKFRRLRKIGDCKGKDLTESRNQTGASKEFITSRRADDRKSAKLLKGHLISFYQLKCRLSYSMIELSFHALVRAIGSLVLAGVS